MKNLNLVALLSVVGGALSLNAGAVDVTAHLNVNTVVTSCASQRGAVTCSSQIEAKSALEKGKAGGAMGAILGSIGEYEAVTIPVTTAQKIGDVKAKMSLIISDVKLGTPDVISFKPTTGKLAGKEVFVAFRMRPKKAGTAQKFDTVDIYARLAEKSADQWFNAGEIIGDKTGVSPQAFVLGPDGTLTTSEPNVIDITLSMLL